ncbi:TylF/MycF/NovP-related O-methyltransferase [Acidomonas methanolica]|nr:TylF/MycF/NovP-related O-methyltransferase [Acidomonas methanolica]
MTFGIQNKIQMRLLAGHKNPLTLFRLRAAARDSHSLLSADEAFLLHELANAQAVLPGVMAEFGVYRGASAALICQVKGETPLHLFDTFEGLPAPADHEEQVFSKGQFPGTLASVKQALAEFPEVHYHPGIFPASTEGLDSLRFSFVHLDVDLHDATLAGLAFFYPRMVPGGIILTHDYSIIEGVSRAFTRFMADKPERVIELSTTQAMVVCQPGAHAAEQRNDRAILHAAPDSAAA